MSGSRASSKMPKKSPAPNLVHVSTTGGPHQGADPRVMRRRAEKMLLARQLHHTELSVALVDDATIRQLNSDYRQQDKATDVLAFAMGEGEQLPAIAGEPQLLGDVIISVHTARRQAKKLRRPLLDELTMLLAHGLLHLLGYDHDNDETEREMTQLTRDLERAAAAPMRARIR